MGRRLIGLLACGLTAGCSTGNILLDTPRNILCGATSRALCSMIDDQNSEVLAQGPLYDSTYVIKKTPAGEYLMSSPAMKQPLALTKAISLSRLQSIRTNESTVDVYAAPSAECPKRYMAVIGSRNRATANAFGCDADLQLDPVPKRNLVFATEAAHDDGSTPWTYRITRSGVDSPRALTAYSDHPAYRHFHDIERGIRPRATASIPAPANIPLPSRQDAAPEAPPLRSKPAPAAPRSSSGVASVSRQQQQPQPRPSQPSRPPLPPPEKVVLPGEVEEQPVVYEKPHVQL